MKNDPEAVRVRRVKALRIGIATLTEILSEIEPNAELAARPAPVADASLEARAQAALAAFNDTREEWRVIARAIAADISNSVRSDLDRARQQLADLVPADGPLDALKAANAIDELLANVTRKLLPLAT